MLKLKINIPLAVKLFLSKNQHLVSPCFTSCRSLHEKIDVKAFLWCFRQLACLKTEFTTNGFTQVRRKLVVLVAVVTNTIQWTGNDYRSAEDRALVDTFYMTAILNFDKTRCLKIKASEICKRPEFKVSEILKHSRKLLRTLLGDYDAIIHIQRHYIHDTARTLNSD